MLGMRPSFASSSRSSQSAPSSAKIATRDGTLRESRRNSARLTFSSASRSTSIRAISTAVTLRPLCARWRATVCRKTSRWALKREVGESRSSMGICDVTAETASPTRAPIQAFQSCSTTRRGSGMRSPVMPKRNRYLIVTGTPSCEVMRVIPSRCAYPSRFSNFNRKN